MNERLALLLVHAAIWVALLVAPGLEHQTACVAYGLLVAFSLALLFSKRRRHNECHPAGHDLREKLPTWPGVARRRDGDYVVLKAMLALTTCLNHILAGSDWA
jgi:Methylamine utilisation protein MauE